VFHMVSCIPQNKMVVLAGNMSGHLEVVMLAMMECMVVVGIDVGMQIDPGS